VTIWPDRWPSAWTSASASCSAAPSTRSRCASRTRCQPGPESWNRCYDCLKYYRQKRGVFRLKTVINCAKIWWFLREMPIFAENCRKSQKNCNRTIDPWYGIHVMKSGQFFYKQNLVILRPGAKNMLLRTLRKTLQEKEGTITQPL
jgi:hypothetical protein